MGNRKKGGKEENNGQIFHCGDCALLESQYYGRYEKRNGRFSVLTYLPPLMLRFNGLAIFRFSGIFMIEARNTVD